MPQISVTEHAVERYRERVKPAFSIDQARRELVRLARNATPLVGMQVPNWARRHLTGARAALEIADGIVLVLQPDGKRWAAVTCKTRGGLPTERREARNHHKRLKRERRRLGRAKSGERRKAKQARAADGLR